MEFLAVILELIGTAAFAVSGAMIAFRKNMDLFGVCALGLTTACGGGLIRDVMLGNLPPAMFREPIYAMTAIAVSVIIFMPVIRRKLMGSHRVYDVVMLAADSAGLGIFTVAGVSAAEAAGYGSNIFFSVFLGTITGVGGGMIRDMMAGMPPYIFVKHIYACAAILGAIICALLWPLLGKTAAMIIGGTAIFAIRLLAAHFRWSLPKSGADALK